jgi:hypothetical protein
MMLPKVGDSLAERIEIHNLWPLSQDEIEGKRSNFLNTLINTNQKFATSNATWKDIAVRMRVDTVFVHVQ